MQLSEQQVVQLRTSTKQLADIFAEDKATPTTQDEVMMLLQNKSTELGFKEPTDFIRSLIPNKGDVTLAVAGIGAGTGAFIVAQLKSMIPQLAGVGPNLLEGVVGWLIYKWAGRKGGQSGAYLSAFGGGMVIGAIANFVATYVGGAATSSSSSSGGVPTDIVAASGG